MKALKILNLAFDESNFQSLRGEINEAIAELEELEQLCDSKYLHKLIDERIEELSGNQPTADNHACENCKYQTYDDNKENCFIIDACIKNEVTLPDNFYCSEWESKE